MSSLFGRVFGGMMTSCRQAHTYSREVLQKLKLDAYPFYIERAWWKQGHRMTFWASFRMLKDINHRKILAENGEDRLRFKAMKNNDVLPQAMRDEFQERMNTMSVWSHPKRILNMCMFTARVRGKFKRFRVNRHVFRRLADHGQLSGVTRAVW